MKNEIVIDIPKTGKYKIYLQNDFNKIRKLTENRKLFLFSDSNVFELYGNKLFEALGKKIDSYVFEAGEKNKNINTVLGAYKKLLDSGYDRDTLILALGGGVCGDLAGFTAATYMRGVDYAQIPTSLIAQVDSSVGGKTGFDFYNAKNIIGAFYQPIFVYTNVNTLKTLSDRDFFSGMGEVIKHGLIRSKSYYNYIVDNKKAIKNRDSKVLSKIIKDSCIIKRDVVIEDEKEKSLRAILNFGHTVGHGIEASSKFTMSHGESICVGMICAMYMSNIDSSNISEVKNLFKYFDLPTEIKNMDLEDILNYVKKDKKYKNNHIRFIKLKEKGLAYIDEIVTIDDIKNGIKKIMI